MALVCYIAPVVRAHILLWVRNGWNRIHGWAAVDTHVRARRYVCGGKVVSMLLYNIVVACAVGCRGGLGLHA